MAQTRSEIRKRHYYKYQEQSINRAREAHMKRTYGIDLAQYGQMVEDCGNLCAICKQPPKVHRLAVDHCHQTGKVRGLLCHSCNSGIGKLGDNIDRLKAAISYLEAHSVG